MNPPILTDNYRVRDATIVVLWQQNDVEGGKCAEHPIQKDKRNLHHSTLVIDDVNTTNQWQCCNHDGVRVVTGACGFG